MESCIITLMLITTKVYIYSTAEHSTLQHLFRAEKGNHSLFLSTLRYSTDTPQILSQHLINISSKKQLDSFFGPDDLFKLNVTEILGP